MDDLSREKGKIPGSNKYDSYKRPPTRGYAVCKDDRVSILEAESFGKKFIPASNKYNPKKDMATISKLKNIPRAGDKPDTTGTK